MNPSPTSVVHVGSWDPRAPRPHARRGGACPLPRPRRGSELLWAGVAFLLAVSTPAFGQGGLGDDAPASRPAKAKARTIQGVVFKAPASWKAVKQPPLGAHAAWTIGLQKRRRLTVVVYRLGKRKAKKPVKKGSKPVDSLTRHVTKWSKRFEVDGKPATPTQVELKEPTKAGVPAQVVRFQGSYLAPLVPGDEVPPGGRAKWAGLYGHLTGPDGVWVVALVGPAEGVLPWQKSVVAFLKSARKGEVTVRRDSRERPASRPSSRPAKKRAP